MPPTESSEPLTFSGDFQPSPHRRTLRWVRIVVGGIVTGLLFFVGWVVWGLGSPDLRAPVEIVVEPGDTVVEIVATTAAAGVVRSETILYFLTQLYYRDETIETGTYTFTPGLSARGVASQLMLTTPADELTAITFPEGITVAAMADIAARTLPGVDSEQFVTLAAEYEGMLWPETYFVPHDYTTEQLVRLLRESHTAALAPYEAAVASSSLSRGDIIILASILEREANDEESMRTVAGILLNRLEIGMPLQADATIEYVLDTPLGQLPPGQLAANLRELDSPYNTYQVTGLPPTPIGNPGEQAIAAVLNPVTSDYLFYITGNDGVFYYAETYDQHLVHIERYLR